MSEQVSRYYKNGQCFYMYSRINGKVEGPYLAWHENGMKECECFYKNGFRVGLCRIWDDKGVLVAHCVYEDDSH
jgi:antitoxin component YwqK of YwqJK toxin-antitoxin module